MSQNLSSAAVVIGALMVQAPITTATDGKCCYTLILEGNHVNRLDCNVLFMMSYPI